PLGRTDPPLAGLTVRVGLEEDRTHIAHQVSGSNDRSGGLFARQQPPTNQMPGNLVDRVTLAPLGLLLLGAVPEGTAWKGAVLMEVAVDVGLDHGRSPARAHELNGFLHGQMDGKRVHAVDLPTRDSEPKTTRREPRFTSGFVDSSRHGVAVVLDEEAQWQLPRRREVERFERRSDVRRTVTEVGDGDRIRSCLLVRP